MKYDTGAFRARRPKGRLLFTKRTSPPTTPQFEYRKCTHMSMEELNHMGGLGWELCAILPGFASTTYFFKREKQ